ncbi:MAG TPA: 23S rRNA (pseudouridine(1915)-N(3))-methyltransferase RlmH [Candidatus Avacidaminococcus intestinavium]|uniref:Ribosomal RNA large subunit methyltransferase H n=1 Tax=Candidatus Avacidaminococcus intestinavium TaxID=2840684 RepID=A0A9D1MP13_9FIRM|nr:23S rRNA (pseudouridine(1915)-N(3))-methyltransferase RlmH [Candidatus Avacidaminococcus intestinavium]
MKISLVCVGKIKEKYLTQGIEEYLKRLGPFCKLEIISINEEKMPDNPSPAEKTQVIAKETKRLLAVIPGGAHVVVLDVIGQPISSPELSDLFDELAVRGQSHIAFVIGGAFGFSDELRKRSDERISFSRLTFTHQMIRLLVVEQIYRAFKISRGEKYHW